jgi:AcrR family transcriptional regulator
MASKQEPSRSDTLPTRRPRRRRKEARPGEILDAALSLWAEQGFAATRLEDVAARAGIVKGTIYLYFSSKEALFEAALRDRIGSAVAGVDAQLADSDLDVEEALSLFLSVIYDRILATDSAALLKVLIGEGHRFPQLVQLYREEALAKGLGLVQAILKRGAVRGELRRPVEALDPRIIMGPAITAALWQLLFRLEAPLDRDPYQRAHLDVVLNGILAEPIQP